MTSLGGLLGGGWLPVAIDDRRESVVLAEIGRFDQTAPSFGAALTDLGNRKVRLVRVRSFVAAVDTLDWGPPARIVAHVGRCGSTLLANLLALRSDTVVLKEPTVLHPRDPALLRALINYWRAEVARSGHHLVLKPTSWSCPVLRSALLDHPRWLLLTRNPLEVVASQVVAPPRWASSARVRSKLPPAGARPEDSAVETFARVWAGIVEAFLSGDASHPFRALDYADLVADRAGALLATQSWFELPSPRDLPPGFDTEALRYSKGRDTTTFDPATRHSRGELDPLDAARVTKLTATSAARLSSGPGVLRW